MRDRPLQTWTERAVRILDRIQVHILGEGVLHSHNLQAGEDAELC